MIDIERREAKFYIAIVGLIVILIVYTLFGSVDLVFKSGNNEVYYVENATVLSGLELEASDIKGGKLLEFTYGEDGKTFDNGIEFRVEIAKTLIINLFTFKWSESDYIITLQAK